MFHQNTLVEAVKVARHSVYNERRTCHVVGSVMCTLMKQATLTRQ